MGQEIEIEIVSPEPMRLSMLSDRRHHRRRACSAAGPARMLTMTLADGSAPHPKSRSQLKPGERLTLRLSGGGGFGDPAGRDPDAVRRDVRDGYVSAAAAQRDYGYSTATGELKPWTSQAGQFDPITLEILWSRLIAIADKSATALVRTSFSTIVRESNDYATALMDADGVLLAENTVGIPSFLGIMPRALHELLKTFPRETWHPGDCVITNDPWIGTGHLPDITMVMPIFHGGGLVGFSGSIAHSPDIGGAGWSSDCREVFEEGIRIPPCRLMRDGVRNQLVLDFILGNVRVPDQVLGDIKAQVTAADVCGRELRSSSKTSAWSISTALSATLQGRAETAMRRAIAAVPDGVYRASVDADGFDDADTHIECTITVAGSELKVDYAGTSPQIDRGINTVMNYTYAYTVYSIKCALDPLTQRNEGSYRPITVEAPEGWILNPRYPAPVNARQLTGSSAGRRHFQGAGAGHSESGHGGMRQRANGVDRVRGHARCADGFRRSCSRAAAWAPAPMATVMPAPAFRPMPVRAASRRSKAWRRWWSGARICAWIRGGARRASRRPRPGDRDRGHGVRRGAPVADVGSAGTRGAGPARRAQGALMTIELADGGKPHPKSRSQIKPGDRLRLRFSGGGGFGDPARRDPRGGAAGCPRRLCLQRGGAARLWGEHLNLVRLRIGDAAISHPALLTV